MIFLSDIVGSSLDDAMSDRLHELSHRGKLEQLVIAEQDARRHRLRARTDQGTDCAVALPRDRHLRDGDILLLEQDRAIVVRLGEVRWLALKPRDTAAGLRLGYHAGNLHWRVRFAEETLAVALDGSRQGYLDRLAEFIERGDVEVCDDQ